MSDFVQDQEYMPIKLNKDLPEPKESGAYLISLHSAPYILVHKFGGPVVFRWRNEVFETSSWREIAARFDPYETATIQSLAAHDCEVSAKALELTDGERKVFVDAIHAHTGQWGIFQDCDLEIGLEAVAKYRREQRHDSV